MIALRRTQHETRIEIMPLIDVVFLLLTFFIYAMVLMNRVDVLPIVLPQLASADSAKPTPAITISIDASGKLFFNRDPVTLDLVLSRIEQVQQINPDTEIYIAVDELGQTDRLPIFMNLYDLLSHEGLDIKLVSKPKPLTPQPDPEPEPQ